MDVYIAATEIVKKLVREGYIAYFAGGWVRDLIMKHPSDDIDIATNAPPGVILDLFPRTVLVGLAFGVVIVCIEGHQFEVSTFRKDFVYHDGRRPTRIEFATPNEDAQRRDFTINGMFYDPLENKIHDFVHGMEDIQRGLIRTIGVPQDRFQEDRLRMIRAVRFASRFEFNIDNETQLAIMENADSLFPAVAMERVTQEFGEIASYPHCDHALIELHRLGLLPVIFPTLKGVHLNELKSRVVPLAHMHEGIPAVLIIPVLFPSASVEELMDLCYYLKVSSKDMDLVEFFVRARQCLLELPAAQVFSDEWARLYAHRHFTLCLSLVAFHLNEKDRANFLELHHLRQLELQQHADRIRHRKPLVTAALLLSKGIAAGKTMGLLLKEAEQISIRYDLHDPEAVIKELKKSELWPGG